LNHYESLLNDEYLKLYYSVEEREDYLKSWCVKLCDDCDSWSKKEYDFYRKISIENMSEDIIQKDHYIDLGCDCNNCNIERYKIIEKIKNNEEIKERIIHKEIQTQISKQIINRIPINKQINKQKRIKNNFQKIIRG
jgi:hypothetical protein